MSKTVKLECLKPCFAAAGGEGIFRKRSDGSLEPAPARTGVGLIYDCPCGCGESGYVPFENPIDGGPPPDPRPSLPLWRREGTTFATLTLSPSILKLTGCKWHGHIVNGDCISC